MEGRRGRAGDLHRALTSAQRKAVEDYLALKYAGLRADGRGPGVHAERRRRSTDCVTVSLGTPDARAPDPLHHGRQRADARRPRSTPAPFVAHRDDHRAGAGLPRRDDPEPREPARSRTAADFSPADSPASRSGCGATPASKRTPRPRDGMARPVGPGERPGPGDARAAAGRGRRRWRTVCRRLHFDGTRRRPAVHDALRGYDPHGVRGGAGRTRTRATSAARCSGTRARYDFHGGRPPGGTGSAVPTCSTSPSIVNGQTWVNGRWWTDRTTARPKTLSVLSVLTDGGVTATGCRGGDQPGLEGGRGRAGDLHRAAHQRPAQGGRGLPGAEVPGVRADAPERRCSRRTARSSRARWRCSSALPPLVP